MVAPTQKRNRDIRFVRAVFAAQLTSAGRTAGKLVKNGTLCCAPQAHGREAQHELT